VIISSVVIVEGSDKWDVLSQASEMSFLEVPFTVGDNDDDDDDGVEGQQHPAEKKISFSQALKQNLPQRPQQGTKIPAPRLPPSSFAVGNTKHHQANPNNDDDDNEDENEFSSPKDPFRNHGRDLVSALLMFIFRGFMSMLTIFLMFFCCCCCCLSDPLRNHGKEVAQCTSKSPKGTPSHPKDFADADAGGGADTVVCFWSNLCCCCCCC
jgi:hypothetical protein